MVNFSVAHLINMLEKRAVTITLCHNQTADLEK